jgi:hypothetical protein
VIDSIQVSSTSSLSFAFAGANDNLVIDTTGGNPVPTGGVSFNGTNISNGDTLTIIGSPGDDSINVGSTSVSVGTGTVSFSNIASVTVISVGGSVASPALLVATPEAQVDRLPTSESSVARMDEYVPVETVIGQNSDLSELKKRRSNAWEMLESRPS